MNLSSANAFNLDRANIFSFGKELTNLPECILPIKASYDRKFIKLILSFWLNARVGTRKIFVHAENWLKANSFDTDQPAETVSSTLT